MLRIVLLCGAGAIALALACSGRALAVAEFCPAQVSDVSPAGPEAATFGYRLTAYDDRSVNASIVADTDRGWFGWSVSGIALTGARGNKQLPDTAALSQPLAVTFPQALSLRHVWVVRAKTQGETYYGWDAKGWYDCAVPAFNGASMASSNRKADEALGPVPTPSPLPGQPVPVLAAPIAAPFPATTCPTPFKPALVTHAVQPEYPASLRELNVGYLKSEAEVAVGADGSIVDAWTYLRSGQDAIDKEVLRAAVSSTYSGAISYCQPVPGMYLFRADFSPS